MTEKTATQVVIDGNVLTLSGYESLEYLQTVAAYLNQKISEVKSTESYRRGDRDKRTLMVQLNIADDYFKEKKQKELLEDDLRGKEEELYAIKHDMVKKDIEIETVKEALKKAQAEIAENTRKILTLEAELKEKKPKRTERSDK